MNDEAIVIDGQVIGRAWVRTALEQLTAAQAETAEMVRRRDAWRDRAMSAVEQVEALQLAVKAVSDERDRALRQLEIAEHLGVELQRRVTDLEVALARVSSAQCAPDGGQR